MSDKQYYESEALGSSAINCLINETPALFKAQYIDRTFSQESKSMSWGQAFHMRILEPRKFAEKYRVLPPEIKVRRGKVWEAFQEENPDVIILTGTEMENLNAMQNAIMNHAEERNFINDIAEVEKPFFWEENGVKCRGKIDGITRGNVVFDIKTTKSVKTRSLSNSLKDYGIATQIVHYTAGIEANLGVVEDYVIIAVESNAPYEVRVFRVGAETLRKAESMRQKALALYRQCKEADCFPGYETVDKIDFPSYMLN